MPEAAVIETEPEFVPPVDALDEPVGPSPLDRREAVMEEVAATRLEELREDGVDIPPTEEDSLPPEDGKGAAPGEGAEPMREALPGEPLYTVTVDGQERQVPLSELTTSYQIQSATRNRLAEAGVTLRRAQEMEQGVLSRAAQPQAPDAAPAGQPTTEQPADGLSNIDFGDLAEKLQYGDKDDAAAALKETVTKIVNMGGGTPGGPPATTEQIELRVLERVEWITALNRFGEDYQDILQDQKVAGVAGSIGRALYQQAIQDTQMSGRPRRPYWDIFREAGEKTRAWRNGLAGQQAGESGTPTPNGEQPAVNLSPERGQRKAAAPQPPVRRSGVARSGARRDAAPKSDEQRQREGIREIQRGRGQR